MLERKQTVVSQDGRLRVAKHTEKSAFVLRVGLGFGRLNGRKVVWGEVTLDNPPNQLAFNAAMSVYRK